VDFLSALATAGLLLAAFAAVVWKFGRFKPGSRLLGLAGQNANRSLRSPERIRLTPQHSVHTVTAAGKTLLIGCHTGGMVVLADLSVSDSVGSSDRRAA
jgi:hypothetical protein